ncbi:MAG: hypothetical protein LBT59_26530 [Clostridiales bacterium]|jgi:hypothetical protein|nr:hypothetical protein [Clostridiales bacterium]
MIRIGMIDLWLDNWHTNHYPNYIRLAAEKFGFDADVTDVWAEKDAPEGLTTAAWCDKYHTRPAKSQQELLSRVDAVMVMCADDCLPHEALAQEALASGIPLYCDKTFAPDLDSAIRMFERANSFNTPIFTCSAHRYCMELLDFVRRHDRKAAWCVTSGPGDLVNYSVHQFELIECLMGTGAKTCRAGASEGLLQIVYDYGEGRFSSFTQGPGLEFIMKASADGVSSEVVEVVEYYMNFMFGLLRFFENKIPPVEQADTLEIMAMQQAARQARKAPGEVIAVPKYPILKPLG